MPFADLFSEHYLVIFGVVAGLLLVAASGVKPSRSLTEKLIRSYEVYAGKCEEITTKIQNVIEQMKEKVFLSVADRDKAADLIKKYNALYNDLIIDHEKVGHYLQKRDAGRFRKYKKRAENTLTSMQDLLLELLTVEQYMQTPEEFAYTHASYEAPQSNENDVGSGWDYEDDEAEQNTSKQVPAPEPKREDYVFFIGCNTEEEVKARYRSLAKVYHPDMPTGDEETFKKMLEEYERKKGSL